MTITFRRNAVLIAVLVIISLLLILLDGRNKLDSPKGLLTGVITPVGQGLTHLGERIADLREADSDLGKQLQQVTAERDVLLAENAKLRVQAEEVEQLREQLGFQDARPELTLLSADVVLRDPQGREKFIVINRGSNDGVQMGMAVVSPNYLVGQVIDVEPDRARVLLVIDSGFQTGARLQLSGQEGVVYGRWQSGGRVIMKHIPVETQVVAGDEGELVITSGKTARIPEGLIIGKVIGVKKDELRNETEAEVLPIVDFDNLQSVTVIIGFPGQ